MTLTSFYEQTYSSLQRAIHQDQMQSNPQAVASGHLTRNQLKYAEKYLFAESAICLLRTLLPELETKAAIDLPAQPVWIEFVQPVTTRTSTCLGIKALLFTPLVSDQLLQGLNEYEQAHIKKSLAWWLESGKPVWLLSVFTVKGVVAYHYILSTWLSHPDSVRCLFDNDDCAFYRDFQDVLKNKYRELISKEAVTDKEVSIPVCRDCMTLAEESAWLYAIAYALAQKHILDSAEEKRPQTVALPYHRRVPMPGKKKHYQDGTHTYHYITFDLTASVRPGIPEQPHEVQPRGSWLEINPETVMYVTKSFASSKRLLDPARNPRWKFKREVTVKEFDKRVPMRIHTIKKLIATKYAST